MKTELGILFDFDGVVSNSLPGHHKALKYVCRKCGIRPPTFGRFVRTFHSPFLPCWRALGVTIPRKRLYSWYYKVTDKEKDPMFRDVPKVFRHFAVEHRVPVGIVSCGRSTRIRRLCAEYGIAKSLSYFACGKESKTENITGFYRRFGLPPSAVWFVGDFASDMRDARLAGVRRVGITRGSPMADVLIESGAEYLIKNLSELKDIIQL